MTLSNSEAKSLGSEREAKSKSIKQVVLGSDGEEVFPVEVVLLGMQLEARFVLISEVSRPRGLPGGWWGSRPASRAF